MYGLIKYPCHRYKTRFVTKGKLAPCNIKTLKFEFRSFKHQGTNILNQLKYLKIYSDTKSKVSFLRYLKNDLIDLYN